MFRFWKIQKYPTRKNHSPTRAKHVHLVTIFIYPYLIPLFDTKMMRGLSTIVAAAFAVVLAETPSGLYAQSLNERIEVTDNHEYRASYALRTIPHVGILHGFGVGFKDFQKCVPEQPDKTYASYSPDVISTSRHGLFCFDESPHSDEFSFNALFGHEKNLYEFGGTAGLGRYSQKSTSSMEVVLGLLRMGITSRGEVMWTPEVGLDLDIYPFSIQPKASLYLARNYMDGFGFSFNAGTSF